MPAWILTVLKMIGSTLIAMITRLASEKVLKKLIIIGLEKVVTKTESDVDDKLLAEAKKAWAE
jgi:hypothetical protein